MAQTTGMHYDSLSQPFFVTHTSPPIPPINNAYQGYLIQFPNGFRKWHNGKDLSIVWPASSPDPSTTSFPSHSNTHTQPQKPLPAVFESFNYPVLVLSSPSTNNTTTIYDYHGLAGSFRVLLLPNSSVDVIWDLIGHSSSEEGMARAGWDMMLGGLDGWQPGMEKWGMGEIIDLTADSDDVEDATRNILKPTDFGFQPREEYEEFTQFINDELYTPAPAAREPLLAPKPQRILRETVDRLLLLPEPEPLPELPELVYDTPPPTASAFDTTYPSFSDPFATPFATPDADGMDYDFDLSPLNSFSFPSQVEQGWGMGATPVKMERMGMDYGMSGQEDGKGGWAPTLIPGLGSWDMDEWGWTVGGEVV
ncbi:hypothetical protein BJ508DRAFT_330811 [Ascobolus immersus RN42]|uniref:Uncharacterized protein n=1 Tax=Ascobolus immersus RN42 TaxID=1160509 RepID=A0A3N4HSR8_ASCIM|nr:hypothetical protein BJ508DRAFT_330811 [Ascobolus immersus RN42]